MLRRIPLGPSPAVLLLVTAAATAGPRDQVTLFNFNSDTGGGGGGFYGAAILPITSSYTVHDVVISGSYSVLVGFACERDAVIEILDDTGNLVTSARPFSGCGGGAGLHLVNNLVVKLSHPVAVTPGRFFEVRAVETYNDSGSGPDGIWSNLTVMLDDGPPFWLFVADAGSVRSPGFSMVNQPIEPGTIRWYKIQLPVDAGNLGVLGTTYLDVDTEGSTHADMEIAIFDADGRLVATDDDSGSGTQARLTFGAAPSRPAVGDGLPYDNSDGSLKAGVYYVALGPFDTAFGPTSWVAGSFATTRIVGQINVRTNIGWSAFCRGDHNRSGSVSVQDIFDFLAAYFAGCP